MAYDFKRLSDVEALTEVPENANALIEVDGIIKKVPGSGLGGATGIKTAIIKDSEYDACISTFSTMSSAAPSVTFECINMTFDEAYNAMANGEPLTVFGMFSGEGAANLYGTTVFVGAALGEPCIWINFTLSSDSVLELYWTANGISMEQPSSGK